jgi:hypothetical protein
MPLTAEIEAENALAWGDEEENRPSGERITAFEAARRADVTRQAVSKFLKARPWLVGEDDLLDAAEIAELLAIHRRNPTRLAQTERPPSERKPAARKGPKLTVHKTDPEIAAAMREAQLAKARQLKANADRAELTRRKEAGELISRAAAIQAGTTVVAGARNRLLRLPDLICDELVGLTAEAIRAALLREIEAVLRDLSRVVPNDDDGA